MLGLPIPWTEEVTESCRGTPANNTERHLSEPKPRGPLLMQEWPLSLGAPGQSTLAGRAAPAELCIGGWAAAA